LHRLCHATDGLKEAEKMDRQIRFYGYYIKRFRYDAEDAKRETHILDRPTVFLDKAAAGVEPASGGIFRTRAARNRGHLRVDGGAGGTLCVVQARRSKNPRSTGIAAGQAAGTGSAETDPPPTERDSR